jgi:hypothetical protein
MSEMTGLVFGVFMLALVADAITESVKMLLNRELVRPMAVAFGVGIVLALATGTDLLLLVGLQSHIPGVGEVVTGLVIGRGSNYLFDFMKAVGGIGRLAHGYSQQLAGSAPPVWEAAPSAAPALTATAGGSPADAVQVRT